MSSTEWLWIAVGAGGQVCFGLRMLVQWYVSERQGRSVVPPVFWHISLAGAVMMLAYAVWRRDPVFMFGQSLPLPVYLRNVMLLRRERAEQVDRETLPMAPGKTPDSSEACTCPCSCGKRRAA